MSSSAAPPKNRAPRSGEAAACLPFLRKQISLVRPHTILLLGATAVRHFLPGKQKFAMKDEVGRIFTSPEHPGVEIMILYHPAYLLRDPRKQPQFVRHVEPLVGRLVGRDGPGAGPPAGAPEK